MSSSPEKNSPNTPPETPLERAKSIFETLLERGSFICFKPDTDIESKLIQEELFAMGYKWLIEKDAYLKTDRIVIDPDTKKLFKNHPDETEKNKVIVKSSIFGDDFQLKAAKIELGLLIKRSEALKKTIEKSEDNQGQKVKNRFNDESKGAGPIHPMPPHVRRARRNKPLLKPDKE